MHILVIFLQKLGVLHYGGFTKPLCRRGFAKPPLYRGFTKPYGKGIHYCGFVKPMYTKGLCEAPIERGLIKHLKKRGFVKSLGTSYIYMHILVFYPTDMGGASL